MLTVVISEADLETIRDALVAASDASIAEAVRARLERHPLGFARHDARAHMADALAARVALDRLGAIDLDAARRDGAVALRVALDGAQNAVAQPIEAVRCDG